MKTKKSFIEIVPLWLAALGFLISLRLTYIHVRVHLDPFYDSVCAVGSLFNCDATASSPYSTLMGVPVSVWSAAFYLVFAVLCLTLLTRSTESEAVGTAFRSGLAAIAVVASSVYIFVSIRYIKSICLGCLLLHLINFGLAAILLRRRNRVDLFSGLARDLRALSKSPWIIAQLAALFLLCIVAGPLGGFPRYWDVASFRGGPLLPHGVTDGEMPWLGAEYPVVTIHEYFDYECPACRASHKKLRRLLADRSDRVRIVRHDMSRVECVDGEGKRIEDRCVAAGAAYCALQKDRFWEFNDAFIADPKPGELPLRREHVLEIAERLGLSESIFSDCMGRPETYSHAQSIYEDGIKRGVKATPTYFVDGKSMRSKELLAFIRAL